MSNPPCFCTLDSSQEASMGLEILHEAAHQEPIQFSTSHGWGSNTGAPRGKLLANPSPKQDGLCD